MNEVLRKRLLRDLKVHFMRYLALTLLIVMGMYVVVGMVGATETIITGTRNKGIQNKVEDGEFTVFLPLTHEQEEKIGTYGVTVEKMFSIDVENSAGRILRVMKNRQNIDLIDLDEGRLADSCNEVVLEKRYCAENRISVGDTVKIAGTDFKVVGIGSTPDYDMPVQKISDVAVKSSNFGLAFITDGQYEKIKNASPQIAEDYTYAYMLNASMTDDKLKELIKSFEFNYNDVTDEFYKEIIADTIGKKDDLQEGIQKLLDGSQELTDNLQKITATNADLNGAADTMFTMMLEIVNNTLIENNIDVVLQAETYSEQLNAMLANPNQYTVAMKNSLQEAKEALQQLKAFHQGLDTYTDGIRDGKEVSKTFSNGLGKIVGNNAILTNTADSLFSSMLFQTNAQLASAGIEETLTEDQFETQLDHLIYTYCALREDLCTMLQTAKEQLANVNQFRNGIKTYMSSVSEVNTGGNDLANGMERLDAGSSSLINASDKIMIAMIGTVNEQLAENGLDVVLTSSNFENELTRLTAANSQVNTELQKTLQKAKNSLAGIVKFKDGLMKYTDAVQEAADGSQKLQNGIEKLKNTTNEITDEFFNIDLDNLTSFVKKADNPRIAGAASDVQMHKYMGLAAGIIVMILFTYVISVFTIHQIQTESSVIGTLYALGVKRKNLIVHYLTLPTVVSFIGGVIGTAIGFSRLGIDVQMQDSYNYFSIPVFDRIYPAYLIIYSVVMPPLVSAIVNYLVINKKLSQTSLSLIKNEQRAGSHSKINIKSKSFIRNFQIRQILRETRTSSTVVLGMLVSLLIFMLGLDCYVLCDNVKNETIRDTNYEYMYLLKYPDKAVPEAATACYSESLSKTYLDFTLDITIMGVDEDNPYFDVTPSKAKNKIVISKSVAEKYGIGEGDRLILTDSANEMDYAFTIDGICNYSAGLMAFMDIDSMRELFGKDNDYYNVLMSYEKLDIASGRLYSVTTKADVERSANVLINLMMPTVVMLVTVAIIIFCVVMYLMMNVMIDRAGIGISLVKIFGYRTKEIKKLYLNGNMYIVAIGAIFCIPLSKLGSDLMYPWLIANTACGMNLSFPWYLYVAIYAGVMLVYLAINGLLIRKLKKVSAAEFLKNRE